jgi:hypothetical protein
LAAESRQEFLDAVTTPFNAPLSSRLVPTIRAIYADGDMVIALFEGKGTARDGKPYSNTYSWYMRMSEGKTIEVVAFFDLSSRISGRESSPNSRAKGLRISKRPIHQIRSPHMEASIMF